MQSQMYNLHDSFTLPIKSFLSSKERDNRAAILAMTDGNGVSLQGGGRLTDVLLLIKHALDQVAKQHNVPFEFVMKGLELAPLMDTKDITPTLKTNPSVQH